VGKATKLLMVGIAAVPGIVCLAVVSAAFGALVGLYGIAKTVADVMRGP